MVAVLSASCSSGSPAEDEARVFLDQLRDDPQSVEDVAQAYSLNFSDLVTQCMMSQGFDYVDSETVDPTARIGAGLGPEYGQLLISTTYFNSAVLPPHLLGIQDGGFGLPTAAERIVQQPAAFYDNLDACETEAHGAALSVAPEVGYLFALEGVDQSTLDDDLELVVMECVRSEGFDYQSIDEMTSTLASAVEVIGFEALIDGPEGFALSNDGAIELTELQANELRLSAVLEGCGWFGPTPATEELWEAIDAAVAEQLTDISADR